MTRQTVIGRAIHTVIELIEDGQPVEEALHTVIRHGEALTPSEEVAVREAIREHQKHKA